VGSPSEPLSVPVGALLLGQKSISASPDGSPATVIQMLDFADRNNIRAQVEVMPMTAVNDALDKVRNGRPRYRVVLKQQSRL